MNYEQAIRLACFLGVFSVMAVLELVAPMRILRASKGSRWLANCGIVLVDTMLVRVVFPAAAVGASLTAQGGSWGLLNQFSMPIGLEWLVALVALDLAVYLQHVMFHAVPILWRLHMVHHADIDIDVTTGLRFHPIEIVVSMGYKIAVIAALGPAPGAVVVFEVILNATSMFNHSNVRLPLPMDTMLRLFVVTPDMHRVHHSVDYSESNSNFGFNLPWWDWLFGTYMPQPDAGHQGMIIGLKHYQANTRQTLAWLLALPFRGETGPYPINRRGKD